MAETASQKQFDNTVDAAIFKSWLAVGKANMGV
jgi:hypothetical protein